MSKQISVPDLGVDEAEVIELLVQPGAMVKKDQAIAVLESDKASLELPAEADGVVQAWAVTVGQRVKQGDALMTLVEAGGASAAASVPAAAASEPAAEADVPAPVAFMASAATPAVVPEAVTAAAGSVEQISVPDLGVEQAEVIELLVPAGATVKKDQPIAVLESDKASLELPAPADGVLVAWVVTVGQAVRQGDALLSLQSGAAPGSVPAAVAAASVAAPVPASAAPVAQSAASASSASVALSPAEPSAATAPSGPVHAGPAVRKLARELGVDLSQVTGSGPRQRIQKDDLHAWVKQQLSRPVAAAPAASGGGMAALFGDLPAEPDYRKWGEVELRPRSRIQRKSAENLARSALIVPQVTQFDLADITELEAFRLSLRDSFKKDGLSLTMTVLVAKAVAYLLREMPVFNSSLARDGENLVVKDYVNIGIAVDTPNGLLVPVLHNADRMSLSQMARTLGELSEQARTGKLPPAAMQGATFSISSLGGVGGTAFTPLVNWPEVGILGLSKASQQPVWDGKGFVPRLMLPLSLSYDHRVIDGAVAARFTTRLGVLLADIRRLLV
ncbi:2-oxo acid dehydrogenase subunit E2 [Perlucidibaca piscinae]|uniref:2-oxo acid dehydrogenase subunit E2 n=1 Tax=Perlucidibaca piscinae TaxID=392589 RepID=UPI0003B33167|nr:2-oxo acid dehydrogenase subunit E2 [Perlucidibaca piscinae]